MPQQVNALDLASEMLDLPEGALAECGVLTMMYLDEDGKEKVEFGFMGETDIIRLSGALQALVVKLSGQIIGE